MKNKNQRNAWKPDEEYARNYIAFMLGVSPDKIVNVEIFPNDAGTGWEFFGNLKVDKPRRHCVIKSR